MKERRYKEDYSLESYIDDRGREKRRAVYRGDWFSADDAYSKKTLLRPLIAFAASVVSYLIYMKLNTPSASCMYVLPVAACALIPMLYWAMGLFAMWRAPRKMTRVQKESSFGRTLRSSAGCMALLFMACAGDVVFLFTSSGNIQGELPGLALLFVSAMAAVGCFLHIRESYNRIRKVSAPEGGKA